MSLFEGINLNGKRGEDESYQDYKNRQKTNTILLKIFRTQGSPTCWQIFPDGFKASLKETENKINDATV